MNLFQITANQSVIRNGKELVSIGEKDFLSLISDVGRCVVCGHADPKRNKEHVIPDWLLRKHNLHADEMRLPKRNRHKFGTYKVLICKSCNAQAGEVLEKPISQVFSSGFDRVSELCELGDETLYAWLSFIRFKTHFKDKHFVHYGSNGEGPKSLGEGIDWRRFRDIHAVARAPLFGVKIEQSAVGTMAAFRINDDLNLAGLNYFDQYDSRCSFLRDGKTAVICAFNDLGGAGHLLGEKLSNLPSELTIFQFLTIFSEFQLATHRMYGDWGMEFEGDHNEGTMLLDTVIRQNTGFRKIPSNARRLAALHVYEEFFRSTGSPNDFSRPILKEIRAGVFGPVEEFLIQSCEEQAYLPRPR